MNATIINVKTNKALKNDAQRLAKGFGLPLSAVINAYLREFVREKRIIFSEPLVPNVKTEKIIFEALQDIKLGKNFIGPFESIVEMDKFLDSVKNED